MKEQGKLTHQPICVPGRQEKEGLGPVILTDKKEGLTRPSKR
jgi:hypothetical protein